MTNDYQKSVDFRGDPDKALECAASVFINANFRVTPVGRSQLNVENASMFLNSKRNPLMAVSHATITASSAVISIEAELGALRRLIRLVMFLILATDVPVTIGVGVLLWSQHDPDRFAAMAITGAAMALPFVIIFPLVRFFVGRSAKGALDTLLHNMAAMSQRLPGLSH